jgi:5,10-methylenetetrahydrofolate reductase
MAQYLDDQVPGIKIPALVINRMKNNGATEGVQIAREFLKKAKSKLDGIHIMSAKRSDVLLNILDGLV